jgi:glycosyltransferase involved in cell wall biosynthesis
MEKVNILYVITKLELGGAQKQLLSLIQQLDKERFQPFLFTASEGLLIPEALSVRNLILKRSRWLERPINPLNDLLALIELYVFIKRNKIAIVHTHSSKAGILGRFAAHLIKVKVIIHTVHGWSFNDYQPSPIRYLFIRLERFVAKFTRRLIVVSSYDMRGGLENRIGNESKYIIIRYGIKHTDFGIIDHGIRGELGINPQDLVVGMISCFKPQKSPQDFISLAYLVNQNLPEARFLLVGDGVMRKHIEKLVCKFSLKKNVIFTGWRKDIPRILSAIDVFVLTSLWEGIPVSILEAMASSKPVVATDTGGVAEVITNEKTGFLVVPGDTKTMSKRLMALLNDKSLRESIGRNANQSLSSDFCCEKMAKNIQDLYKNLILDRKP